MDLSLFNVAFETLIRPYSLVACIQRCLQPDIDNVKTIFMFIQCKKAENWYQVKEWNKYYHFCIMLGVTPVLSLKTKRGVKVLEITGTKPNKLNDVTKEIII